jgi:phage tail sheath protein FI
MSGAMTAADPDPALRHGYTLARLDELAGTAVSRTSWRFISVQERFDVARSAIAEGIHAAAAAPAADDLVRRAVKAIRAHVGDRANICGRY